MIANPRVLFWFGVQFVVGVAAAVTAMLGFPAGLLAVLAGTVLTGITLKMSWKVRDEKDALKNLSDGAAVLGLGLFLVLLLFTGNIFHALGVLLFAATLAQNLLMREYRQLYFGLMAGFVFVLAGAAEAVSGYYLLVFGVYALATSFCFGEIWLDRKAVHTETGHRPSVWQRGRVAAAVMAVATVIYLVMPRPPAANLGNTSFSAPNYYASEQWEAEADGERGDQDESAKTGEGSESTAEQREESTGEQAESSTGGDGQGYEYEGFKQQMNVNEAGKKGDRFSNAILAYMRAPHGTYLRMRTFDQFDGIRWSASTERRDKHRLERGHFEFPEPEEANYRQVIELRHELPPYVPVAQRPVELWLPASVMALDAWGQPVLPERLQADTRYTVDSRLEWYRGRPLGSIDRPRETDLQLPSQLDSRIPALARRVTRDADSRLEAATALEQHLRNEYEYSLQSVFDSQGETPLPRFLFEQRKGHCEYFASAMAVMLRSLDIPARLITGFSVTQKNPMTGYFEIRALDGHAWVEAWIAEAGWVTFEPTAFYDMPRPNEDTLSAEQVNRYVERLRREDQALEQQAWTLERALASLWHSLYTALVAVVGYLKVLLIKFWPALVVVLVLGVMLVMSRDYWQPRLQFWLSRHRIRRYRPGDARKALHFYLHHLQRMAAGLGIERSPGEPIEHWAGRLRPSVNNGDALDRLVALVNRTFYRGESIDPDSARRAAVAIANGLGLKDRNQA